MTDSSAALTRIGSLHVLRSGDDIVLYFPVLRAPGIALAQGAFALLCGLMPALGLSALLPLDSGNAAALLSLALIGGFAAPFILASIVFALLAIYLAANALHVEVRAGGIHTERRIFGQVVQRRRIDRADIAGIEPRIGARYQNVFSTVPRYALIAQRRGASGRDQEVIIAEDLAGQPLMIEVRTLICAALKFN